MPCPRFSISALAMLAALAFALPAHASPVTYNLDPSATSVIWQVSHEGFSNLSGRFGIVKGQVLYDSANYSNSSVDVTIDLSSLATGVPAFDKLVLSKSFLDAAGNPTAAFNSTKVSQWGNHGAHVTGNLTLRGVTLPVMLNVNLNKIDTLPETGKKTIGFTATGSFRRSAFGISGTTPPVADEVRLNIQAEAH
jgi:polyisoprenoid-binding protein YceI